MGVLDQIYEEAKRNPQRIAPPEALSKEMVQAAYETGREGYTILVLAGYRDGIRMALPGKRYEEGIFTIADTREKVYKKSLIDRYVDLPQAMLKEKALNRRMQNPLYYTMVMQAMDEADVTSAGIDSTIGDMLLAGQTVIGLKPGTSAIFSIGLCDIPGLKGNGGSLLAIGDNAVCANPDVGQLTDIAIPARDTVSNLLDQEPGRVMVNYSTLEGGQGELVDKAAKTVAIADGQCPDLAINRELQFDAAVPPQVVSKKASRESWVTGRADVVIWLDLSVENVGMKLIQQLGCANAYGPIFQGFDKVACDCSRGAPVSEIRGNIVISTVRTAGSKGQGDTTREHIKH